MRIKESGIRQSAPLDLSNRTRLVAQHQPIAGSTSPATQLRMLLSLAGVPAVVAGCSYLMATAATGEKNVGRTNKGQ